MFVTFLSLYLIVLCLNRWAEELSQLIAICGVWHNLATILKRSTDFWSLSFSTDSSHYLLIWLDEQSLLELWIICCCLLHNLSVVSFQESSWNLHSAWRPKMKGCLFMKKPTGVSRLSFAVAKLSVSFYDRSNLPSHFVSSSGLINLIRGLCTLNEQQNPLQEPFSGFQP